MATTRMKLLRHVNSLVMSWRGRLDAVVAILAATVAHYIFDILVARTGGLRVYGVFAVAFAYAFILATVSTLGFPELANRQIPRLLNEGRRDAVRSFALVGITVAVVAGLLSGLVIHLAAEQDWIAVETTVTYSLLALVPTLAVFNFLRQLALLSPRQKLGLFAPTLVLVVAAAFILVGSQFVREISVLLPLASLIVAYLVVAAAAGLYAQSMSPKGIGARGLSFSEVWSMWSSSAGFIVLSNIATVITAHMDLLLIAPFASAAQIGTYAAASRLSQAMTLPLAGISLRDVPLFGRLLAQARYRECWLTFRESMKASGILSALVGVGLVVLAPFALGLYGADSRQGWLWLSILVAGRGVSAATGPVALFLITLGHARSAAAGALIGLGVSALLILTLGNALGPGGVALGKAMGLIFQNMTQYVLARQAIKRHGVSLTAHSS